MGRGLLKLANLPGGFEVRGGRMLARYGAKNATHLHSWDFVDAPLVTSAFLGDGGLAIDGGDVTWAYRGRGLTYGLVGGFGAVVAHDHGHSDAHDDDVHDDDAHDDDAHDEHDGHAAHGWEDGVAYGRWFGIYQPHDFAQWTAGLSLATGENEDHETRRVYGLDLTYQWRERGLAPGGRALRWTTELLVKSEKAAHEEDEDHDDHGPGEDHGGVHLERETDIGLYTQMIYSWHEKLDTGLRLEYVAGGEHGDDRYRVSPVATYRPLGAPGVAVRLQYNYDDFDHDKEHTVWAQLGLAWGGAEVR
jgi:hypothetical protein